MKHVCILLVRFYQKFLSPLKRNPTCRYYPTCSAYAIQAFQKRGFFVGFGLTVWRILRCNPYGAGGYDPVPEKKMKAKRIPKYDRSSADENISAEGDGSQDDND